MTTTLQQTSTAVSAFRVALERREPGSLLAMYSEQAVVCLAHSSSPHRMPRIVRGKTAIAQWVQMFCARLESVSVVNAVDRESEVTIIAECRRHDGTRFVLACTAKLNGGLLTDQFVVVV